MGGVLLLYKTLFPFCHKKMPLLALFTAFPGDHAIPMLTNVYTNLGVIITNGVSFGDHNVQAVNESKFNVKNFIVGASKSSLFPFDNH